MTKTLFASLIAATLFSATAAMANTSADTAPDRLPMATPSSSAKVAPSPAETAAMGSMVWEGGQAGTQVRPAMTKPMARGTASHGTTMSALQGAPYQFGAAN